MPRRSPGNRPRMNQTPQPIDLTLNLNHAATPGDIHLDILQFGSKVPDQLDTKSFSEPAKIEAIRLHSGDTAAELTGTSLPQVKSLRPQGRHLPAKRRPRRTRALRPSVPGPHPSASG